MTPVCHALRQLLVYESLQALRVGGVQQRNALLGDMTAFNRG